MKIKITLLALLLGVCFSASAQIYSEDYIINRGGVHDSKVNSVFGVVAGVNMPVMSDKQDIVDITNTAGYQFGMMWGLDMGALEIVPEIWYQHSKSDMHHKDYDQAGQLINSGIEVPIIFAMNFFDGFRLNLGPSLSLVNNSKYRPADGGEDVEFGRTKSTMGYVVGLSATFMKHFILDARYTGRFVSVESDWHNGYSEHDYRYYNYSFNVGYRF